MAALDPAWTGRTARHALADVVGAGKPIGLQIALGAIAGAANEGNGCILVAIHRAQHGLGKTGGPLRVLHIDFECAARGAGGRPLIGSTDVNQCQLPLLQGRERLRRV